MNYLHLMSWYYQGIAGEVNARGFFAKLQEGTKKGVKFPFDCPFQVALVHCTVDEHWCVGILVMRGMAGDDSIEQSNRLSKWYEKCGTDPSGADKDANSALHPSVEGTLQARYGSHYRSVEVFGTIPGPASAQAGTEVNQIGSTSDRPPVSEEKQEKAVDTGERTKCPHCGKELSGMALIMVKSAMTNKETLDFQTACPSCERTIRKQDLTARIKKEEQRSIGSKQRSDSSPVKKKWWQFWK